MFVRPWNDKPNGWFRAFAEDPRGAIQIGDRQVSVRAVRRRGARVLDAVDAALREKYPTPGSRKFVVGFARPSRRVNTLELVPR